MESVRSWREPRKLRYLDLISITDKLFGSDNLLLLALGPGFSRIGDRIDPISRPVLVVKVL